SFQITTGTNQVAGIDGHHRIWIARLSIDNYAER
ncbi:MAG: hypothetical protein ACI8R8_001825, partial [Paraglaciecola sp.]